MIPKYLVYFIVIMGFLFSTSAVAEKGKIYKIKQEHILRAGPVKNETLLFVKNENMTIILQQLGPQSANLLLTDLQTGDSRIIDKVQTQFGRVNAKISYNHNYVIYGYREVKNNRFVSKIFELNTNRIIDLESSHGDLNLPSISPQTGKIVYDLRIPGEIPKIYLADLDGSNARYVADGLSGIWSPNGRWFIFSPVTENQISPKQKYKAGKITKEEFQEKIRRRGQSRSRRDTNLIHKQNRPSLVIYNSNMQKQIELDKIGRISGEIEWSPDGSKLAFRVLGTGLYIVDLGIHNEQIIDYNLIFVSEYGYHPTWSPSGNQLAYEDIKENASGDDIANSDIYIVNSDGTSIYNLTNTPQVLERNPIWVSNMELIVLNGKLKENISKLELQNN